MENIIANAVNHFRSNKQNLAYEKAKAKKQPAEPFSGISLQSTNEKVYFANPYQSAAALAPPMFSTPISFSSNFDTTGNVPIVETQKYVEEVEEQNIETDIMAAQQAMDPDAEQSEDESDSDSSYDSDEHELNERKLDELNEQSSSEEESEDESDDDQAPQLVPITDAPSTDVPLPSNTGKRTIEDDVDDNKRSRYDSPDEESESEDEDESEEQIKPPQPPPPPPRKEVATIQPVIEEQLQQPFKLKDALNKKFKSIRPDSDDSSDEEREFDGFGRGGAKRTLVEMAGDSDDDDDDDEEEEPQWQRPRRVTEQDLLMEGRREEEEQLRRIINDLEREEDETDDTDNEERDNLDRQDARDANDRDWQRGVQRQRQFRMYDRRNANRRRGDPDAHTDEDNTEPEDELDSPDEGGARTFPGGNPGAFKKYREAIKKGDEVLAKTIKAEAEAEREDKLRAIRERKERKRKEREETKPKRKKKRTKEEMEEARAAKAEKDAKKAAAKAEKEAKMEAEKTKKAAAKARKDREKFAAQFYKKTKGRGGACNRCKYGSLQDIADKLGCT